MSKIPSGESLETAYEPAKERIRVASYAIDSTLARVSEMICSIPTVQPNEIAFSCPQEDAQHQVKAFFKKTVIRIINDLWDLIAQGVDAVAPLECENCFAAAGYDRN